MKTDNIKIIDYKAGNAPSVLNAVRHLGHAAEFASSGAQLIGATHIILPGVGSAQATMDSLRQMDMIAALEEAVLHKKTPFLGICVGLQILFEHSAEGDAKCLGWLKGRIVRFGTDDGGADRTAGTLRVPQMGWNKVSFKKEAALATTDDYFYFVNSYHAIAEDAADVWGVADYGSPFTAAVQKDNIHATQFHIEKSGAAGLGLLEAFLRI